ncbi:hypothetical protein K438DRAFT_1911731 [Mycena galopus ATCC 62051]|nr:hypothetical protein K438DRAFT_1911731 [Mycena galopus ATCC 62051]
MFLLDTLDNLPRLRVSSSLMRVFLWILKEANCKDVPSFDHLRRVQKELRAGSGIPSIPCKSVQGNVFFMNDPKAIIAKDWANPVTRKLIHVYPEIPEDGVVREFWHADKWRKNMDLNILSPMYDAGVSHYYVNEVSRLRDGQFVIPIRWVKFRGRVYADAFAVTFNDENEGIVSDTKSTFIAAHNLDENYYDLEQADKLLKWAASSIKAGYPARMPNPKRIIAAGRPMYSSFVNYFSDDVSGNRSKSWNKHWNAYMTHQNLPRKILQQEFHVHFISTSQNTSVPEQFCEFKAAVEYEPQPLKRNFKAGIPRTKELILEELEKQVEVACSGVLNDVKKLQTGTGVKDIYTQFWIDQLIARFKEMRKDEPNRATQEVKAELIQWTIDNRDKIYSFDPTRDTPIEILHTILLGIIKYIWHITHSPWSPEQKRTYAIRLQSTNTDGLSIHAIRSTYIMQYAGSLIGRQFKTIAQVNIFHVRGLVTDDQFMAWKAAGELAALLWFTEIRNSTEYRRDLKVAIANVLDIFAAIDPSKIITKIKFHLLVHAPDDVSQFGPLIGVATEIFESFNGLADQEGLKHRLTGGQWPADVDRNWVQAGSGVTGFLAKHPIFQRLIGWAEQKLIKHGNHLIAILCIQQLRWLNSGDIKLVSLKQGQKERQSYSLATTAAARALNYGQYSSGSMWRKCVFVVSESLDECLVDSPLQDTLISGRISDILVDAVGAVVVVLELFQVLKSRDEVYGMPVLVRRDSEVTFLLVPAKNVKFKFNVQHDCESAECEASGQRLRMQERTESDQIEKYIIHKSLDRFLINTHAFHNAHLLRATLPRDLVAPIPLFLDRQAKHYELAAELREKVATRKARASDDEAGVIERPQKSRKISKRKGAASTMVAARPKRTIIPTQRAMATPEPVSEGEDSELSGGSDEEAEHSDWFDSDGDYSD